jgi:hypothetical protein
MLYQKQSAHNSISYTSHSDKRRHQIHSVGKTKQTFNYTTKYKAIWKDDFLEVKNEHVWYWIQDLKDHFKIALFYRCYYFLVSYNKIEGSAYLDKKGSDTPQEGHVSRHFHMPLVQPTSPASKKVLPTWTKFIHLPIKYPHAVHMKIP